MYGHLQSTKYKLYILQQTWFQKIVLYMRQQIFVTNPEHPAEQLLQLKPKWLIRQITGHDLQKLQAKRLQVRPSLAVKCSAKTPWRDVIIKNLRSSQMSTLMIYFVVVPLHTVSQCRTHLGWWTAWHWQWSRPRCSQQRIRRCSHHVALGEAGFWVRRRHPRQTQ